MRLKLPEAGTLAPLLEPVRQGRGAVAAALGGVSLVLVGVAARALFGVRIAPLAGTLAVLGTLVGIVLYRRADVRPGGQVEPWLLIVVGLAVQR